MDIKYTYEMTNVSEKDIESLFSCLTNCTALLFEAYKAESSAGNRANVLEKENDNLREEIDNLKDEIKDLKKKSPTSEITKEDLKEKLKATVKAEVKASKKKDEENNFNEV